MKTIGIIGGLGPQTTADLYLKLQELIDVEKTGNRPHIIIDSVPITTFLETENIIHERNFQPVLPLILRSAKRLEDAGADVIILACNSLHIFTQEIRGVIKTPFLSIIDATVKEVVSRKCKSVGLLGTYKTNSSGMFTDPLEKLGINVFKLDAEQQASLSKIIIRLINNTYSESDEQAFLKMVKAMFNKGAESVILACTDFHLLIDEKKDSRLIDTMQVLARQTALLVQE